MSTLFIFALLIVLMLTGMPISIALGLTVLTFLFTMTDVPVQAVALKLFTGIEKFEIMAIPFFILAGNFLTHDGLRAVCRSVGLIAGDGGGHWFHSAASDGESGLSEIFWCRRDHHIGGTGHSDTAVDCNGDVLGVHQYLGGAAVHGGRDTRSDAGLPAGPDHLGDREAQIVSAHAPCKLV